MMPRKLLLPSLRRTCGAGSCTKAALYYIGWEVDGLRRWEPVCGAHDRYLGRMNIMGLTGWNKGKVLAWDNAFIRDEEVEALP
jgi:hypothetical protein